MKINSPKLQEYFIQLLIVIIGVFLGMLVTDWNTNQRLAKDRRAVLKSIKSEVEVNKANLEANWENRRPFFKSLDSLEQILTEEVLSERFFDRAWSERLPNWKGFGSGRVSNSMFETAKYGNVLSGMDIELLQQLSKTYSLQETTNKLRQTLMDKFFSIDTNTEYSDVILLMWRIRQELEGAEAQLVAEYVECNRMIEEKIGL